MAKMAGSIKIIVGCSENSIDPSDDNKVLTAKLNIGANEDIDKILTEILPSIGNFNSWVNQKIDLKSDNLFAVQKFIQDENDEIEFDSSYWSIYHQKKQNIIYGIIENDEFYQFTEYNGAWYIDENLLGDKQTIELVFNPVYSNFIECSLGKNKLLSVTNYNNETNSIEVSLAGIDSNVVNTHGRLIYITYLINT